MAMLHHYCTLDGLLGIVQNQCLWAGDSRFLNDRHEVKQAKHLIEKNFDMVEELLKDLPGCDEVLESLGRICGENHLLFVISFSREPDNLSQWRSYGDRGKGVCIGFDEMLVRKLGLHVDAVHYGYTSLFDAVIAIAETEAATTGRSPEELATLDRRFVELTAMAKHEAFADEREVRLLVLEDNFAGNRRFRRSGQFLTSYREVSLASVWTQGVLRELCVGPCQHESDTQWALLQFLAEMGAPGALVHRSKAPFREW